MNSHASTSHWTEPPSTGVTAQLFRAYLVQQNGAYRFARLGPPDAAYVASGGTLRLDDDPSNGKRIAIGDTGRVTIY